MTTVDPNRSVLVLVDLMERIVALPLAPRTGAEVVKTSLALAERFRAAGAPVVGVRVERPNVAEQPAGSGLVEPVAALADAVVVKRTLGAFHETGLRGILDGYGATTLVFGGIATNLGVESTARAAADHGYDTVFVEDAMAALTAREHEAAVTLDFPRLGAVTAAAELDFATPGDA